MEQRYKNFLLFSRIADKVMMFLIGVLYWIWPGIGFLDYA